ncbi:hypothetical protein [Thalassospira xiamenensis]|uniref:hypothetical protein n=1 Tax=Thalassospira xiamenensis TaxID=220697 RepID=UPI0011BFDEE8|nr:hypothetical protein [Thalassospira xiamenensis]
MSYIERQETAGGLRIKSIEGRAELKDEKVVLRATKKIVKSEQFLLYDNTFSADGKISNEHRHLFHLKLKEDVAKDEEIHIWTKSGKYETELNNGLNRHHYFWGLRTKVWNSDNNETVHLVHVSHIATKKFPGD